MRTYPPNTRALTPYSVSPRRNDQSRGPNPTKNSSTLIPNALAVRKWPDSWTMMTRSTTRTNNPMPTHSDIRRTPPPRTGDGHELQRLDDLGSSGPRPPIGPGQRHLGDDGGRSVLVEGDRHHLGDLHQPDLPFQEGHHRDLVGRIEGGGIGAPQTPCPVGQADRGERLSIQFL